MTLAYYSGPMGPEFFHGMLGDEQRDDVRELAKRNGLDLDDVLQITPRVIDTGVLEVEFLVRDERGMCKVDKQLGEFVTEVKLIPCRGDLPSWWDWPTPDALPAVGR